VRLDVDPRVDAPAAVWTPVVDGTRVIVASSRIGTVSVDRSTGRPFGAAPILPTSGAVRAKGPDGELLGSAGQVIAGGLEVRSVDDELVAGGWRLSRFAWAPGGLAAVGTHVLAWELDGGKIRRAKVDPRAGLVVDRSEPVSGDRAIASAFARDGRGILVTDREAHGFDAAGHLRWSKPLPAPEKELRILPTTAILAGSESYVFLEGRILLRLPDLPTE
jgi:hypothetical protein